MKVVHFEDVTPVRGLEHRGGTFHSRTTAAGEPGTPGNFKFSISDFGTDYSGPRHRHNFDQYRYMLSGESDYGQDGPLRAGMLGYYPEGVPYGPQVNKTPIVCAVLQFGGASGSGYLQPREVKAGMEELRKHGEFKDGIFTRRAAARGTVSGTISSKRNMDAYQAIWEHVHGREMVYPKGRYDAPIMMDAASYQWAPIRGAAGASEKLFGVFTERRTQARLVKLAPRASYAVAGRGVYLVLAGAGEADGQPLQKFTTVFLDTDEHATLRAGETTELLHYGLPDLADVELGYGGAAVQAAESPRPIAVALSRRGVVSGAGVLALGAVALSSRRARAADFYRGKTLTMIVGFAPGGGVDTQARTIARHLVRFIPGQPGVIVQNMEGAAGALAASFVNRAAPDGLTVSTPGRSWFVEGVVRGPAIGFDPTRFTYIGSAGGSNSVVYVRAATGIRSLGDLRAAPATVTFGSLASTTPTAMVPQMLAGLGFPIRVVLGYVSTARVLVALEQGEIDAVFTVADSFARRQDLIAGRIVLPILQSKPGLPDIPLLREVLPPGKEALLTLVMGTDSFGLPLVAPPGVAGELTGILRKAFIDMVADKDYQADALKADLPVGAPLDGPQLAAMIADLARSATPDTIAAYRRLAGTK